MTAVFLWNSAGENKWQDENKDQSKSATRKTRNTKKKIKGAARKK